MTTDRLHKLDKLAMDIVKNEDLDEVLCYAEKNLNLVHFVVIRDY